MTWDSRDSRDTDRMHAALAKRARKAAKREEDARRTEEVRARPWSDPFAHWSSRPLGIWDREERWWFYVLNAGHSYGSGLTPRWRARLNHRRSLPMGVQHRWYARICSCAQPEKWAGCAGGAR